MHFAFRHHQRYSCLVNTCADDAKCRNALDIVFTLVSINIKIKLQQNANSSLFCHSVKMTIIEK